jgi:hypothetical protein
MKKVLLLLLLSLLSTQSFAKLCPDGSIPTRAISGDGSFYEYKCVGKQNTYKANTSYGPKRLFDYGTSWMMGPTGLLEGTNGLTCRFLNYYVGTCNNGVNYGLCSNSNNKVCGSDGSSYTFPTAKSIRSSFGSSCRNNGAGTHSVTCNSKSSSSSSSYSSKKIPFNAHSSGAGWECNTGYAQYGSKCVAKSTAQKTKVIPENAYSTGSYSSGDGWDCKGGYEKYNNGCRKKSDPENSYSLSEDIPLNSHKSGGGWECNTGYSQYGNKCVAKSTTQETKVIQNESSDYLEEIKQAKVLLDSGVITEDEFKDIKKKIIDNI